MNRKIDTAVAQLRGLLRQGWEWPDASAKAAAANGVTTEALAEAYESQEADRALAMFRIRGAAR